MGVTGLLGCMALTLEGEGGEGGIDVDGKPVEPASFKPANSTCGSDIFSLCGGLLWASPLHASRLQ
jgi:hypothetical protein